MRAKILAILIRPVLLTVGTARRLYWFLLRPTTRGAKVLLVHDGEVLFVRHTYDFRVCSFPGGGLKRGEDPLAGIKREVREELGIHVPDASLIGTLRSDADYSMSTVYVFSAALASRDELKPDPIEIAEVLWAPSDRPPLLGPAARQVLELYRASLAEGTRAH